MNKDRDKTFVLYVQFCVVSFDSGMCLVLSSSSVLPKQHRHHSFSLPNRSAGLQKGSRRLHLLFVLDPAMVRGKLMPLVPILRITVLIKQFSLVESLRFVPVVLEIRGRRLLGGVLV